MVKEPAEKRKFDFCKFYGFVCFEDKFEFVTTNKQTKKNPSGKKESTLFMVVKLESTVFTLPICFNLLDIA